LSKPTDHTDPIAETRHRALGVRRPAESWIDDDVDFDLKSVRSRTIELSAGESTDTKPVEDSKKRLPKVPSIPRPSVPSVSMPSIPTNTKDLVHGTAQGIDNAALKAAETAKDVGNKSADVARVGAEKVNVKRRAGLPPGRDHERRNKPRVAKVTAERRPRKKVADRVGSRPDRIVLWAVILGIVLIFIAATSSSKAATGERLGSRELHTGMVGKDVRILHRKLKTTGFYPAKITSKYTKKTRTAVRKFQKSRCMKADGVAGKRTIKAIRTRMAPCGKLTTPTATPAAPVGPELGYRVLSTGATGDDVRVLQKLLNLPQTSVYDDTTVATIKGFQSGAGIPADGVAGPQTINAIGSAQPAYKSTWYGPGFFGNTTACAQILTTETVGVAHQTLPCGTEVILYYKGRFKKATVIDRGPYANGAVWDLTQATASAIGLLATDMVNAKF
jgi:peptidoglycan hydrolase-like protein with peptidoglycan-binding domain